MESEFEKGAEYERKRRDVFFHLSLGWICVILSPIWFYFLKVNFIQRLSMMFCLLFVGIIGLWVGYSKRKEIKKIEKQYKLN